MVETHDSDVLRGEPPAFDIDEAAVVAADLFDLHGTATPLGSERDQGFLIQGATGPVGVLKISNASEDAAIVDMETAAALHVLAADPTLPVSAPLATRGADVAAGPSAYRGRAHDSAGAEHLVRASTFMPGVASIDPLKLDGAALFHYGVTTARLGRALRSFFHPSAGRTMLWDVQHASSLRPMTEAIEDRDHRALIDGVLDRFETDVVPRWWSLRSQVIHGDVTLDNALVDDRGRISGIIDFGDMSHSALVCDLSAALESVLQGRQPDDVVPLAMRCIDGYRSVTPLEPEELAVLPDLLSTRLATVAVLFGWRARRHPDNAYLRGWEERLWPLLAYLEAGGRHLLGARLRAGEPVADAPALDRAAPLGVRAGAVPAHVRPPAAPRARGGRVAGGCRRRPIPGLLQQRAGRRSLPSARHRRDRAPDRGCSIRTCAICTTPRSSWPSGCSRRCPRTRGSTQCCS